MELAIRDAELRDLPEIKRLTDEYLSRDFYSMETLEEMLTGERNMLYVVTDTDRDGKIVSYFYAFLSGLEEALRILHVPEKPEALKDCAEDFPVGVYKASCTEKKYRRNGVCSSFVHNLQPVMREKGAKMILATALHPRGREIPMKHIFEDNGFRAVAEIDRPWRQIHAYCPYCGQDYCACDGVFFVKELGETEGEDCHG